MQDPTDSSVGSNGDSENNTVRGSGNGSGNGSGSGSGASPPMRPTPSHTDSLQIRRAVSRVEADDAKTPAARHEPLSGSSASSLSGAGKPRRRRRLLGPGGLLQPFRLLRQDARNLGTRWRSDWTTFNQLVLASAVYVFFTNILPGITFASDLSKLTGGTWGTIEVVFSTGICGIIFSLLSAQPLTILGVTGPFSVLAENIYHLCVTAFHVDFLSVMAWSLIHAAWMHYLLAIFNAHDYTMQYVTNFSGDIFSLLNSVIYFYKAGLELSRTRDSVSYAAFLYAVIGAAGTCLLAILLSTATSWKPLFHRYVRLGLCEYAAAISIIVFVVIPHTVSDLSALDHEELVVQTSFRPTDASRTVFFVRFWTLPVGWIFASMIPAAIITALFFFDHEISSIICTVEKYGVRKPGGFAWDIVLLGTTTAMCGILGIPPANGLLPQAPLHSESLLHTVYEAAPDGPNTARPSSSSSSSSSSSTPDDPEKPGSMDEPPALVPVRRVYEQRYSPFLQAALITAFVSPPLQWLLGLTPTSVLAGLFMFMGYQSLSVNPLLKRIGFLLTPPSELPPLPQGVTWLGVHMWTVTQVIVTGIVFAVTLTVAAPAFPVIIVALVPLRLLVMNRIWGRETRMWVDRWACKEGTPEDEDEVVEDEAVEDEVVEDKAVEDEAVKETRPRGVLGRGVITS